MLQIHFQVDLIDFIGQPYRSGITVLSKTVEGNNTCVNRALDVRKVPIFGTDFTCEWMMLIYRLYRFAWPLYHSEYKYIEIKTLYLKLDVVIQCCKLEKCVVRRSLSILLSWIFNLHAKINDKLWIFHTTKCIHLFFVQRLSVMSCDSITN